MLSRLLELLREGGTRRIDELALALDTTPALVELMLEDLARRGYVERVSPQASGSCARCSSSGHCTGDPASMETGNCQLWVFVEDDGG